MGRDFSGKLARLRFGSRWTLAGSETSQRPGTADRTEYSLSMDTIAWLLDGDPAIRWQAMRDLTSAPPLAVTAERARVPREGLGEAILAQQERDGSWRREDAPVWLPTLFTFLLLRATGADRNDPAVESAVIRLETSLHWSNHGCWELRNAELGGNLFFAGEVEPCINGGVLALGAYFGRPNEGLARRLLGEQLEDGGWNCEAPKSVRSSFHTTLCVLEGLLEYERAAGTAPEIAAARRRGEAISSGGFLPASSRTWLFSSSRFRRATTTTFFALSTTSGPRARSPIRAWARRSTSSKAGGGPKVCGCSIARMTKPSLCP
jgi:hypothetical protein